MQISDMTKQEKVTLNFAKHFPELDPDKCTLNVTYDPAKLTPARSKEIEAKGDSLEVLVDGVLEMVHEWDLMDGGSVVPLERETLMNTPAFVLGMVLEGISQQIAEKAEAEGKA